MRFLWRWNLQRYALTRLWQHARIRRLLKDDRDDNGICFPFVLMPRFFFFFPFMFKNRFFPIFSSNYYRVHSNSKVEGYKQCVHIIPMSLPDKGHADVPIRFSAALRSWWTSTIQLWIYHEVSVFRRHRRRRLMYIKCYIDRRIIINRPTFNGFIITAIHTRQDNIYTL